MSEELGPVTFGKREEHIFLGREFAQSKDYSEETARVIDGAIKNMVLKANQRARDLLAGHRDQLQALALALLDKETLDAREIDRLMASVSPPEDAAPSQDTAPPLSVSLQSA